MVGAVVAILAGCKAGATSGRVVAAGEGVALTDFTTESPKSEAAKAAPSSLTP